MFRLISATLMINVHRDQPRKVFFTNWLFSCWMTKIYCKLYLEIRKVLFFIYTYSKTASRIILTKTTKSPCKPVARCKAREVPHKCRCCQLPYFLLLRIRYYYLLFFNGKLSRKMKFLITFQVHKKNSVRHRTRVERSVEGWLENFCIDQDSC